MSNKVQAGDGQDRGLAFSVNFADEKAGVSIVFQSLAPQDAPLTELNAVLDKITDAAVRQLKRLEIPRLRVMIDHKKRNYENAMADFDRIEARVRADYEEQKAKGKFNPSTANAIAKDRQDAQTSLKRWQQEVMIALDELAEAERIVNGHADKPADNHALHSVD